MGEVSVLKIIIEGWDIRRLYKENKLAYLKMAEHHNASPENWHKTKWPMEFESHEAVDKYYFGDWEAYVNSPQDVDISILPFVKWKPILPLKMLGDQGVMRESVVEAVKLNQVRLPDNIMLQIREVCAVEDLCTDALQKDYLNDGWKILAVLPQAGQRRPDYVLCKI